MRSLAVTRSRSGAACELVLPTPSDIPVVMWMEEHIDKPLAQGFD